MEPAQTSLAASGGLFIAMPIYALGKSTAPDRSPPSLEQMRRTLGRWLASESTDTPAPRGVVTARCVMKRLSDLGVRGIPVRATSSRSYARSQPSARGGAARPKRASRYAVPRVHAYARTSIAACFGPVPCLVERVRNDLGAIFGRRAPRYQTPSKKA
jgi:hypothetical protein